MALIWLGIGSIKARRWARALLLIFSWSWLIMGIFMTAIMPFVMAKVFANLPPDAKTGQPAMPPAAITAMVIGMTLFFVVFFVLVPAVWTFFYNSRHVKATCEARDPVTRWTDACPLPVLGFCLWTWFGRANDAGHVADRSCGDAVFWRVHLRAAGSLLCLPSPPYGAGPGGGYTGWTCGAGGSS